MKKIRIMGILLLLVLAGCTTSRITSSWKASGVTPVKYEKIMVLGLIHDADRRLQENMENHFVDDLKELGYNAVSSLQEYGPKAFDNMSEESALKKIGGSGIDAIITIVLLDKERESRYVPGRLYYSPYAYYYNRFWGYRTVLYHRIYESGYYITDTRYFWESNLYEMSTQKLVYSVQTESFDPSTTASLAHEYGQLIVNSMIKESVLMDLKVQTSRPF